MVKLLWFPDNDTNKLPEQYQQLAHTLAPIDIQQTEGIITQAVATFPPIQYLKSNRGNGIIDTEDCNNKNIIKW